MTESTIQPDPEPGRPTTRSRPGNELSLHEHLARVIHDNVLQSLAVSLLQAELCRRLWESGQSDQAFSELGGVVSELEAAAEKLREVMTDLRAAGAPASRSA